MSRTLDYTDFTHNNLGIQLGCRICHIINEETGEWPHYKKHGIIQGHTLDYDAIWKTRVLR